MPGPFALLVSMFLLIGPAFTGLAGVTPPLRVLDGEAVEVDEVVAKILRKNRRATQEVARCAKSKAWGMSGH